MGEVKVRKQKRNDFHSSKNTRKHTTLVVATSTQDESRRDSSGTTAVSDRKRADTALLTSEAVGQQR